MTGFLRNHRAFNANDLVSNVLRTIKILDEECQLKFVPIFFFCLVYLSTVSDEQGERFLEDMKQIEDLYQGR